MLKKFLLATLIVLAYANASSAEVITVPLYKLAPVKAVDLKCINGVYSLQIPVPERWRIKRATLGFDYVNSTNLISEISQLVVKLDNYPLAQRKLSAQFPEGNMSVDIPVSMLKSGYHTLTFQTAQHFSRECERPCSPDLWTTINLDRAALRVEYELAPVPLKLSYINNYIFDPKTFPYGEVNIVTADNSSNTLTLAGIVASGIAKRFDYKKVYFSMSRSPKAGMDNVLIGDGKFVEQHLGNNVRVSGPLLKITHLKADTTHALIVVSGNNTDEIKLAAETLANISHSFPGTDEARPTEFKLPEIIPYSGRLVLSADKKYDLKTLNLNTHTFEGINPAPKDITFRLPSDFLIKENQYADLVLNFVYSPGMRGDSVMTIMLNNRSVRAIHLNQAGGDNIEGYKIHIPTYLFKPGNNTLSFVPVLVPNVKECDLLMSNNMFLTLFENSTLYFPPMPHFVELPAIELFMLNAFPFTRWPDGYDTLVYVAKADEYTVASAMNVIGMMTQKNGFPLFGIKVSVEKPDSWKGELIVIGDVMSIPDELKAAAPLKLLNPGTVPYQVIRNWEGEANLAYSKQTSGLGPGLGALMEFESPYKRGRTALMFTASNTGDVWALTNALLEAHVQAASAGDMVLVDLTTQPEYRISSLSAGGKYSTGKLGRLFFIDYYLYSYPLVYQILIIVLIASSGLALFFYIRKVRRRRLNA